MKMSPKFILKICEPSLYIFIEYFCLLEIMDDIHIKEERTIKSWTNRKNSLDECFQYVIFEKSSKEVNSNDYYCLTFLFFFSI